MEDYPNDGAFYQPQEPDEQVRDRAMQATKAQAAKPMLEELIAKVEADIQRMSSVDAIQVQPEANPEAFMKAWYGVQERMDYARELKAHLESLLTITH